MLTQPLKDAAAVPAVETKDALGTWPDDVPEKAVLLAQATSLVGGINGAVVPPPRVRYPDRDTRDLLTPNEMLWGDDPDRTPRPAATGATALWQDQLYGSGYEQGFYYTSGNAPVKWSGMLGDREDAAGVLNGPMAVCTFTVPLQPRGAPIAGTTPVQYATNTTPVNVDVTVMMKAFQSGKKNFGLYLAARTAGPLNFYSRFAPSNQPTLTVTTTLGQVVVPCARSIYLDNSSLMTKAGSPNLTCAAGRDVVLVYFDLAGVAPIVSATMNLTAFNSTYAIPATTVDVFYVSNPGMRDPLPPIEYGVAAKYARRQDLIKDPSIYWTQDFTRPDWKMNFVGFVGEHSGSLPPNEYGGTDTPHTLITDPTQMLMGELPWLEVYIKTNGNQSALWSHAPLVKGRGWRADPVNDKPLLDDAPEKLHLNYYVDPTNWEQQPDGGKFPGFNMRFAALTGTYPTKFTPVVIPDVAGMSRGNSGSGVDGLTGSSARGNGDRQVTPGAPLQRYQALGVSDVYTYNQQGPFGTTLPATIGYGAQLPDGPSCIDLFIQMNDVTQPTQRPRRVLSMTQVNGVATVTLMQPETDPLWKTGEIWTFGGVGLYSGYQRTGYQGPKTITVLNSTQCTFPCDPKTVSPAVAGYGVSKPVWMLCCPGQGIDNGILEMRVNGRLVMRRTNMGFRHCRYRPDGGIYGIDSGWFVFMEGGGLRPAQDASIRIAACAMGSEYIGPMLSK